MKTFRIITSLLFILMVTMILSSVTGFNPLFVAPALVLLGFVPRPKQVALFTFTDLLWADGKENMGGLKRIGWFAPISTIDNFPALVDTPATAEDEVSLESVTGFTFLNSATFHRLYSTQETSFVTDEIQGEINGQSFVHKAQIFFPGTEAEALAFAKAISNTDMVFIFEEISGRRRVIGSKDWPAVCKPVITTGQKAADRKGLTLEISSQGYTPAPLYSGAIDDGTSGSS